MFKHGDAVTYDRLGVESTGVLLDRAPVGGTWWVHTDDPALFDLVKAWASGRRAGRVDYLGRYTATGTHVYYIDHPAESA